MHAREAKQLAIQARTTDARLKNIMKSIEVTAKSGGDKCWIEYSSMTEEVTRRLVDLGYSVGKADPTHHYAEVNWGDVEE